jgi:hypothetical protein
LGIEIDLSNDGECIVAIDNPIDAYRKAYPDEQQPLPETAAMLAAKLVLPGFFMDVAGTVFERLGRVSQDERAKAMFELLLGELKRLQDVTATKADANDLKEACQLAIRHDAAEFNDKKRDRYIKIIGNAIQSESRIDDLASFIQDVEQLGERDFTALKVLNRVMNKPNDWGSYPKGVLHPNTFIHRRQELAVQMAEAFGIKTTLGPTAQTFSHEEGYEACTRLHGFGLAHEIELSARQIPVGEYCFRPSKRGLTLLKLVGEQVENWDKYFPNAN